MKITYLVSLSFSKHFISISSGNCLLLGNTELLAGHANNVSWLSCYIVLDLILITQSLLIAFFKRNEREITWKHKFVTWPRCIFFQLIVWYLQAMLRSSQTILRELNLKNNRIGGTIWHSNKNLIQVFWNNWIPAESHCFRSDGIIRPTYWSMEKSLIESSKPNKIIKLW